ncbi:MAG: hypothetical protein IT249_07310 [Chitinophagaceae bacterium]|nr:hypothetical protein [Chitinophagaceae bacterium]
MIKKVAGETWKPLQFPGSAALRKKYAVSNLGRVASFSKNVHEDGQLLSGSLTTGYRSLNLHRPNNKGTLYIHREIARIFCKKPSPKHQYVIHVNYNKIDNKASNLKWATLSEVSSHQQKSPAKVAYKKVQANRSAGLKLNAAQVSIIKKSITDPKRKLTFKQLAEKYKISEMTLYRIKSGENWSRVK